MFEMAAGAAASGTGGIFGSILPLVLMFAIFYFLLIRPQQKKQKQRNSMLSAIKKGDRVITIGGIHGSVLEVKDDTVIVRISDNTKVTIDRGAVSSIISEPAANDK